MSENMFGITDETDLLHQSDLLQRLQIAIGPLVLLLVLYYGCSYLSYETTIKRSLYEITTGSIPGPIWRLLHRLLAWAGASPRDLGDGEEGAMIKSGTLQRIYSGQGMPSVMQRARSLSGFDRFANSTIENSFPGLGNWDNSCFQNSILQGLASLTAFTTFVERDWRACLSAGIDAPALEGLRTFMAQLQQGVQGRRTIWPPAVLRSMNTWQQQDAQEYLSTILDSVEKEVTKTGKVIARRSNPGLGALRRKNPHKQPDIRDQTTRQFDEDHQIPKTWFLPSSLEGFLSQKLRCQKCGFSEGVSLTSFNCLTLNLGLGGSCYLESLLDAYFDPELIDGVECDECTKLTREGLDLDDIQDGTSDPPISTESSTVVEKRPKVLSTKAKHILFSRLPPNLAIHINRSIFDDWGNQRKNNSFVEFPARLKIWGDWVETFGNEDIQVHAIYELRCIINHSGRHDNGHYVACGKRGKDWFLFNDEIVTKTSEADILARGNVFMLFYERLDFETLVEVSTPESDASQASSPNLQSTTNLHEDNITPVARTSPTDVEEQSARLVTANRVAVP